MKSAVLTVVLLLPVASQAAASSARSTLPAARQVADLKSFLHGEPAPPPKAPPPKVTATVTFAPGVVVDPQVEAFLRALAGAIKAREGRPLLPQLSDKYTVADLPEDHKATDFFLQAIERIPGPTGIIIQSVERKNEVRVVRTEFHYESSPTKMRTFKFDAAGRLLASDLFSLRRVHVE